MFALLSGTGVVGPWVERFRGVSDQPVSSDATPVLFTVVPGATASQVGSDLEQAELIRSAATFRLAAELQGVSGSLRAGEHELRRNMTVGEILSTLTSDQMLPENLVTIPEGWRAEEIAHLLDGAGVVPAAAFLEAVSGKTAIASRLPSGATTFEGYLFPDTYDFGSEPTPDSIVQRFLEEFNRRVDESLRIRTKERGLTLHEAITLASIIEREAVVPQERREISAVYHNRLQRDMLLQADPTTAYALVPFGTLSVENGYWKRDLTALDLQVDSPYNTYRVGRLPPAPISNPGIAAIEAASDPARSPWLYFVRDAEKGDGTHLFAESYDEHLVNEARRTP
ncbi:MAG: endolytic transglycosylase MltG [Chloroflexi bacterium]|nr:endolytic transglycosylase MltG [Chloroflexota bacterium]